MGLKLSDHLEHDFKWVVMLICFSQMYKKALLGWYVQYVTFSMGSLIVACEQVLKIK